MFPKPFGQMYHINMSLLHIIPAAHCLYELGFRSIRFASVVHQCLISYDLEKWRCVIVCSTWWDIHSMSRNVARYNFDTHQLIWLILGEMLARVRRLQIKNCFIFLPHLTSAFALPGKVWSDVMLLCLQTHKTHSNYLMVTAAPSGLRGH